MLASLTQLCPSNSLPSNYQMHRLHKIQITVTFFLTVLEICLQKKRINCIYREKNNIA